MATVLQKEIAHKIINDMPDGSSWDDLMRELYVREAVERGYADSVSGKTMAVREVRAKYGLPE